MDVALLPWESDYSGGGLGVRLVWVYIVLLLLLMTCDL